VFSHVPLAQGPPQGAQAPGPNAKPGTKATGRSRQSGLFKKHKEHKLAPLTDPGMTVRAATQRADLTQQRPRVEGPGTRGGFPGLPTRH
jgi:hypothetical protein